MGPMVLGNLPQFMETLGLDEVPMGIFFTDTEPVDGFTPESSSLPTREKEMRNEIDWQKVFSEFSCAIGHIWRARKKQKPAFFSAEKFGCPGCAFWMGFNKPQVETIIHYVSSGIPGRMEGEKYCDSPDNLRKIFELVDPMPAKGRFCVFKPIDTFQNGEAPELVSFFARPEVLSGLHQLAAFVTNDPEVVVSPWSAACGSLVVWPFHYLSKGLNKAVLGGWDPSARKFFKTDELSFTVPVQMFCEMVRRYPDSFLMKATWQTVHKKIKRSRKAWDER